jgi:hypothetical protein
MRRVFLLVAFGEDENFWRGLLNLGFGIADRGFAELGARAARPDTPLAA